MGILKTKVCKRCNGNFVLMKDELLCEICQEEIDLRKELNIDTDE